MLQTKEGYEEKDGKFYNAKGEEVEASEAQEEVADETETPEGDEESKSLINNIEKLVDNKVAAMKKELDTPVRKNINVSKTVVKAAADRMPKEERFKQFVMNVMANDRAALKAAGSTTNLNEVIPPTDFVSEVFRLEEEYGVAMRNADVRRTDRTSITMILGDDNIQVTETAEAGVKASKKLNYSPFVLTFKKFAGILPLTDEVIEDSAINLWNDATQRFARAFSRKKDELVFTHATSGIVNTEGIYAVNVTNVNAITFDDINKLMYGVPTPSMANGKYYFHRTILGVLQRIKDSDGRYILAVGPNGPATGTLWGRPYELTEVLPTLTAADSGDEFIVFGDLKNVVLAERTQLKVDMSNTAVVADPDGGADLNSWTQDLTSMRVVQRFNAKVKFPAAFGVIRANLPVS